MSARDDKEHDEQVRREYQRMLRWRRWVYLAIVSAFVVAGVSWFLDLPLAMIISAHVAIVIAVLLRLAWRCPRCRGLLARRDSRYCPNCGVRID